MLHLGRLTLAFMAVVVMLLLVGTTRANAVTKSVSRQDRPVARPAVLKSWRQRSQSYFSRQKDYLDYIRGDRSPAYGEPQTAGR